MAKKTTTKKAVPVKPAATKAKAKALLKVKPVKAKAKPAPVKAPVAQRGFSKAELAHFKELIIEKRKEILDELETLKASMMDVQTGEYVTENSTYSLHMEQGTDHGAGKDLLVCLARRQVPQLSRRRAQTDREGGVWFLHRLWQSD